MFSLFYAPRARWLARFIGMEAVRLLTLGNDYSYGSDF